MIHKKSQIHFLFFSEEFRMKKVFLVMLVIVMIGTSLTACAKKETAAELGPALVTVSGSIGSPNSGSDFVMDQAYFDANSVEVKMDDPWMGDGITYKGVLLRDLLTAMKVPDSASKITVVATDGKGLDIAIADAKSWDIMLARWADGTELTTDTGGPVKIVFPADSRATYTDEQWMWWITTAKVN
jgi:hypothetical protein